MAKNNNTGNPHKKLGLSSIKLSNNRFSVSNIMNRKEMIFEEFFGLPQLPQKNDISHNIDEIEDRINEAIDDTNLAISECEKDNLSDSKKYTNLVKEKISNLVPVLEEIRDVEYDFQTSYIKLERLFIRVLEEENINLSKYSALTEKEWDVIVRKRKIDSILGEESDD